MRKAELTTEQAKRVLLGHGIIVKHHALGHGTGLKLTDTQRERFDNNLKRGAGFQLRFDEEQREHHQLHGKGVFTLLRQAKDIATRFISGPRTHASPTLRKQLASNDTIVSMKVARTPLNQIAQMVATVVSDGNYDRALKDNQRRDAFHVSLILTLENGQEKRLEKNHIVQLSDYRPQGKEEMMYVPMPQRLTVKQMLDKAEKIDGKSLWVYSATQANCGDFVASVLHAIGIHSRLIDEFIAQDKQAYFKSLGLASKAAITLLPDLAARLDHAVNGTGIRRGLKNEPRASRGR